MQASKAFGVLTSMFVNKREEEMIVSASSGDIYTGMKIRLVMQGKFKDR